MKNLTLEERLNNQLGETEQKLHELEDILKNKEYQSEWQWRHIRQLSELENLNLPIPRLEIRYRLDNYNAYADYGLVIRHLMGHIDFIPFSSTRVSKEYASNLSEPFRDSAHAKHDGSNLNLPIYIVFKDTFKKI